MNVHEPPKRATWSATHSQVHSRHGIPTEQDGNVVPGDFEAHRFSDRVRVGLVGRLFKHRSETAELTAPRFVDDHLLVVFVHSEDIHLAGDDHIGRGARVAGFVDSFARCEGSKVDLACQHGSLFIVEQGKERGYF